MNIEHLVALALFFIVPSSHGASLPLEKIKLPPGFKITVFAPNVPNARSMALSPSGVLYVGTREDRVYAIKDGQVHIIAKGLNQPNGVAFRDGSLYVAEIHRVTRYDKIEQNLDKPPVPVVLRGDLPKDGHHGWKVLHFSPDGKWLYFPIGGPCNVCTKDDPRYASMQRMYPDGSHLERVAFGIRNSVGFDWHPKTGELWFTDNGRDNLGDDLPPDELNYAPKLGMDFGFPYCHGGDLPDPEFGKLGACNHSTPPAMKLGAHVASLGMRFYRGKKFPAEYQNQIFIAEHGSWNRSHKSGYRITLVKLEGSKAVSYEPFLTGWLQGEAAWGRPVDVQEMPDGDLLISDDFAGAIYRVTYSK